HRLLRRSNSAVTRDRLSFSSVTAAAERRRGRHTDASRTFQTRERSSALPSGARRGREWEPSQGSHLQQRRTAMRFDLKKRIAVSVGVGLAWAHLSHAEPAIATRKTLTLDGARDLIAAAQKIARARHTTGAVAVVDDGGNLVALDRLDGTFAAASNIAIGKARTAAQFKKPTRFFEDVIAKGRTAMTALPDFTPLGGGLPLMVDGQLVGAVGVSGAASAKEDEELAAVAAAALPAGTAGASVRLIDKQRVSAAF